MAFSDHLLDAGSDIWDAQLAHPFVTELADGTLDRAAFRHWVEQDYRYLHDYARTFALAGAKANDPTRTARLYGVAHTVLDDELDLHRAFAADYALTPEDLEATEKAPTCVAYTNFLVRTAHEAPLPVVAAAVYPCGRGYLDVAEHVAERSDGDHRYTPFVEKYTSDAFRESVAWMGELVDDTADENPGARDAMRDAFLLAARLEYRFWEMAYTREGWEVGR